MAVPERSNQLVTTSGTGDRISNAATQSTLLKHMVKHESKDSAEKAALQKLTIIANFAFYGHFSYYRYFNFITLYFNVSNFTT